MAKKQRATKGKFGDAGLPVADAYARPPSRRPMLVAGLVAVAALLGLIAYSQFFSRFGADWATKGPLSSGHAAFGEDCSNCHEPGLVGVSDERCSVCHEKFGDELGTFTFASHYVYRSDDFRRVVPGEGESRCAACHVEHEGRHAEITRVPDGRCRSCHFGSFVEHPEFDFAAEAIADSSALHFPHVKHTREVMKRLETRDVERVCLACHEPDVDGRGFEPLSFDRHCDSCHLSSTDATPGLPLLGAGGEAYPGVGVETLQQIVDRGGPGTRWAYFSNPAEFRLRGSVVVKAPVHHLDHWLLDNLRRLRRRLYPDAGLADLLRSTPESAPGEIRLLYREAIEALEEQVAGLRGRPEPEIQSEVKRIGDLLARLKAQVEEPFAPLDETEFLLAVEQRSESLDPAEEAAIDALVGDLTRPCAQCHEVPAATIARVQKDQRQLVRAEFDHRAHIVQARCLDCHSAIPIADFLEGPNESGTEPGPEVDRAAIQNLPSIETCRTCHTERLASDRCVTCHLFHPDKSHRADLLLYQLTEGPAP